MLEEGLKFKSNLEIMRRTVLSINANKPMNYMLQTVLSEKYSIIAVQDVFQGMQQLKTNKDIQAIVVDADFNSEECWEFIQHIKSSWIYNRPLVVLTSDKNLAAGDHSTANGVDYLFQKPFSPVDLTKTIDALLYTSSTVSV
jgi:response regulator RpfG family c-di-GMP phosphodiesterase